MKMHQELHGIQKFESHHQEYYEIIEMWWQENVMK